MRNETFIALMRQKIDNILAPFLAESRPVALLDFPNYSNVGDSAIWLGELAYLRSLGIQRLRYTCALETYTREDLASRIGSGTILISGGGNLGDLWPQFQHFREEIISAFPGNPIIQLPQSIHFEDRGALLRARDVFNSHPRLTLLVRDRNSLAIAKSEFKAATLLCPDMSFCLGPLARPGPPSTDIVWLARTDKESGLPASELETAGLTPTDWLIEGNSGLVGFNDFLTRQCARHPLPFGWLRSLWALSCELVARQRLLRGCSLLATGRTVITDRLHGHVLSLLLGIPHFLLDNRYGKLRSFYETWTSGTALARWCDSATEALELARSEHGR